MQPEEQLVRDYFGDAKGEHTEKEIMKTERMMKHHHWHMDPANMSRLGNYGERFLLFHKQYIEEFDNFRISKGHLRVSSWNPSTPIPDRLAHEVPLMAKDEYHPKGGLRDTNNPYSVDTLCKTPSWLTFSGGSGPDPIYGHRALWQFASLDQLGFAIDAGWHSKVHNTIGGDMQQYHSPIDPIFWPWHKWIEEIRSQWTSWDAGLITITIPPWAIDNISRLSRWLVRAESSTDVHTPFSSGVSKPMIDVFLALEAIEISHQVTDSKSNESLSRIAANLLNNVAQRITTQSSNTEAKDIHRSATATHKKKSHKKQ
jgi:Common central domain of tyrosinase